EAVDATVLAPPVRIDGAVERNIGGRVARDDGARPFHLHVGLERREILDCFPTVVENVPGKRFEAAAWIESGAAPSAAVLTDPHSGLIDNRIGHRNASAVECDAIRPRDLFHTRFSTSRWE